jgi:organic radical activating enzyme
MPKQSNETYHDYKRRVIDIKSESFCAAKWYNATIWLGSGQTTSCHHPPAHSINLDDIKVNPSALHNTQQKKAEREQMQQGQRPRGCEYCWKIEDMDSSAVSDRVYKTVIYNEEDINVAFQTPYDKDINLKTLEIAFDRTCQFACSYCNPAFSSSWVKDIRNNGPYVNLVSDGRNHFTHPHDSSQLYKFGETNPYVEAFFQWWETDLHQSLDELRITGGEPLMSGHTWQLIDWFKSNQGKSQTRLAINSNLGLDAVKMADFVSAIESLPHIEIYTSNEAIGAHAEYIRDGLDYTQWITNMHTLIRSGATKAVHVMCTINALCLESLPEFLDQLIEFKNEYGRDYPNFTLNILRFPSFQSPLILPIELRKHHAERLSQFLVRHKGHSYLHDHEIAHIDRLVKYLVEVDTPHSEAFDMPKLHNDFREFYKQYDQRRGKDFVNTFPALTRFYKGDIQ